MLRVSVAGCGETTRLNRGNEYGCRATICNYETQINFSGPEKLHPFCRNVVECVRMFCIFALDLNAKKTRCIRQRL